jgi:hypothetical protein
MVRIMIKVEVIVSVRPRSRVWDMVCVSARV